jgi:hypothetical protein
MAAPSVRPVHRFAPVGLRIFGQRALAGYAAGRAAANLLLRPRTDVGFFSDLGER